MPGETGGVRQGVQAQVQMQVLTVTAVETTTTTLAPWSTPRRGIAAATTRLVPAELARHLECTTVVVPCLLPSSSTTWSRARRLRPSHRKELRLEPQVWPTRRSPSAFVSCAIKPEGTGGVRWGARVQVQV